MDKQILKAMAKELARKVNAVINIPLIKEDDEEAFFEMIILMLLDILLSKLGDKVKTEK